MKDRSPAKVQPLTQNVPPESEGLFGNDLSKRVSQSSNTNNALTKTLFSSCSGRNNGYLFKQAKPSTSANSTPKYWHSSHRGRATDFPETQFSK